MSTNEPRYGTVDRDYGLRLATTPPEEDGPVWMVNLMKYRDVADYSDGREKYPTRKSFIDMQGHGKDLRHRLSADDGTRNASGLPARRLGRRPAPTDR